MFGNRRFVSAFFGIALLSAVGVHANAVKPQRNHARPHIPIYFEENIGQTDVQYRFLSRGAEHRLFIAGDRSVVVLPNSPNDGPRPAVVRMRMRGARKDAPVHGDGLLSGKSNYFIGRDPARWRIGVAQYAKVRVRDVYRGIDLVYYGNERLIEYDFIVGPGADPRQIRLDYEGADRVDLDASGDLVLQVAGGELRQRQPVMYQDGGDGIRHHVRGAYRRLSAREIGFAVGSYDRTRPLVIDPVLSYSTYLGGSNLDFADAIAVDSAGSAYIAGFTDSVNFPTANALQGTSGTPRDAFVAKLDPSGTSLVYSTYLGGNGSDGANAIAVDAAGNAYVTGATASTNFPTANALQASRAGNSDAFVTKLNPSGTALIYSTYVGGTSSDVGIGIALDATGSAHIAGQTLSANFPTANAFQATHGGGSDGFVMKLNPAGSAFVYSTYLGGNGADTAHDIALDGAGNAYVTGVTTSFNFPTASPLQASKSGGDDDGFVTKLNPSGSALVYSTYLGGTDSDGPAGIAVDGGGNAYIAGLTFSTDFPTANPLQANSGDGHDAFVTKLNASGTALVYSTYLGGSSSDSASDIEIDATGNAYVTGATFSTDFPTLNPVQPRSLDWEAFVTKVTSSGSALIYSTYFGGNGGDFGRAIAIGVEGTVYFAGRTESTTFPTLRPIQAANAGFSDAVVAAFAPGTADMTVAKSHGETFRQGQTGAVYTIVVSNIGLEPSSGTVTVTDTLPPGLTATAIGGTGWTCTLAPLQCTRGDALANGASYPPITLTVDVSPAAIGMSTNTVTVTGGGETNIVNNTGTDVMTLAPGTTIPIPALDRRMLVMLALLLAALGIAASRCA